MFSQTGGTGLGIGVGLILGEGVGMGVEKGRRTFSELETTNSNDELETNIEEVI